MVEKMTFPDKASKIKPWRLPAQKTYIFQHANVINTVDGSIRKDCSVRVSSGIIESITDFSKYDHDKHATTIDLQGRYICPGLIDAHVHLMAVPGWEDLSKAFLNPFAVSAFRQSYVCGQILSRGFTSVRDCGGATFALKEAIEDGVFPGPRMFISVHALSQTGGHSDTRVRHHLHSIRIKS
jgi:imidazolonepropionase-like amidohydrolase